MNPVNELSLAVKHLSNFVGSGYPSGLVYQHSYCALGALRFVASICGVARFNTDSELLKIFENDESF